MTHEEMVAKLTELDRRLRILEEQVILIAEAGRETAQAGKRVTDAIRVLAQHVGMELTNLPKPD